jgi:hypothetical protein
MTFSLDGGIGLVVIVALWLLVMVPSWGRNQDGQQRGSTSSRNFATSRTSKAKNPRVGVSKKENFRNRNRRVRRIFTILLIASIAMTAQGLLQAASNVVWLIESAAGVMLFSFSASVLRSTREKALRIARPTEAKRAEDLARMAYFVRESALNDVSPDELFDERVWTGSQVPESSLNRRVGAIDMSQLAEVVSLDGVREASEQSKFDSEQLDLILKRRRSAN